MHLEPEKDNFSSVGIIIIYSTDENSRFWFCCPVCLPICPFVHQSQRQRQRTQPFAVRGTQRSSTPTLVFRGVQVRASHLRLHHAESSQGFNGVSVLVWAFSSSFSFADVLTFSPPLFLPVLLLLLCPLTKTQLA
jgi:hypothetical protein